VKILRYTNTLVMTPVYTYDLRDDRDRDLFERELKRGNEYLEYNKRIMRNGKLLAASDGQYIGTYAPYGYNKVDYKEGRRTCHTLEPHPVEAPVVQRVFELYKNGVGTSRICAILNAEHVKPARSKKWATESIVHMLNNEHYLGKVRWNYYPVSRTIEEGEVKKRRIKAEDYLLFEGRHPAIIDQETWDAVQAIRGQIVPRKRHTELRNPLAGLLRCKCGKPMAYKGYDVRGNSVAQPRYACHHSRECGQGSAQVTEVMDEVIKSLEDCIEDFEVKIEHGADNSAELHLQLIARLEKKLAELQELEVRQWDEKTKGGMPDHVFARLNAQTVAEIEEVNQALCDARDSAPQHVDLTERVITLRKTLDALKDPDAPVEEQNKLLKLCIERITYSRPPLPAGRDTVNNPPLQLHFTMRI
jgi:translation elongation factor P/translation initiation factor 5A